MNAHFFRIAILINKIVATEVTETLTVFEKEIPKKVNVWAGSLGFVLLFLNSLYKT